ncbi:MAG: ABC transporter substrate-binding protein [Solirubrobacteraceae bacterium]
MAPAKQGGTLRVASQTPTAAVNPLTIADLGGSTMLTQTGEFLAYDDAMTRQLRPMLATSWSPSSDGAVWTFKLRTGVKFHDGRAMSANDVVYTFKEQTDPKNASNALSTFEGLLKPEGVVRLDDLHRPLERGALQEQDLRQSGGTLRRDDRSADPANDRGQDSSQLRRDALSIPYFKALAIGSELLYNHRRLRIRHRSEG